MLQKHPKAKKCDCALWSEHCDWLRPEQNDWTRPFITTWPHTDMNIMNQRSDQAYYETHEAGWYLYEFSWVSGNFKSPFLFQRDLWPGFGNLRITKETSRDFRRGSWWQGFVNTSMIFFRINFYGDIYSNQTWNVRPEKRWKQVHGFTGFHGDTPYLQSRSIVAVRSLGQTPTTLLASQQGSTMFFSGFQGQL